MNEVQFTIAAAVIIPGTIAAGIFILPTAEEPNAMKIQAQQEQLQLEKEKQVAGLFSNDDDNEIHVVVLQPFVVMGGVFTVHLEAKGDNNRSTLCTNLPIVHDAVLTELHHASEDPAMQPPGKKLKNYADAVRHQINAAFDSAVVSTVVLAYADLRTFNANYNRMQTGSSKRCTTNKT